MSCPPKDAGHLAGLAVHFEKVKLGPFCKSIFFSIFISADFGKNVLIMTQVWLVPEALAEGY